MATLKIWETVKSTSELPLLRLDERTNYQAVSFTGTAGTSAAFDAETSVLCVIADAACAIRVGANPTAITDDYPLVANTMKELDVKPGDKISVIAT